jgi:hypothetical protein
MRNASFGKKHCQCDKYKRKRCLYANGKTYLWRNLMFGGGCFVGKFTGTGNKQPFYSDNFSPFGGYILHNNHTFNGRFNQKYGEIADLLIFFQKTLEKSKNIG